MARGLRSAALEYFDVGSAPAGASPVAFSMACRFYALDATSYFSLMFHGDTDVANFASLATDSSTEAGTLEIRARAGGVSGIANTVNTFTANTWHHACAVFATDTSRTVYLDGDAANKGTDVTDITLANHDQMNLGRSGSTLNADHLNGRLAEVAVWNVALGDADVAALAAGYSPDQVRKGSLIFYAPLIRDEDRDIRGGLTLTPS